MPPTVPATRKARASVPDNVERPESLSDGLWHGLLTKVRRMEQQELSFYRYIEPLYDQLFPTYLTQLQREYYHLFSPLLTDPSKAPTFDLTVANQHDLVPTWTEELDSMLTAIEDEWEDELEAQLEEAHDDGWYWFLWMLDQQDEDVLDGEDPSALVPDKDSILPYLVAGAIGGLSYAARAEAWKTQATEKARQQVGAIVAQGGTWTEAQTVLTRVLDQYRHGLSALGADELYLARTAGEERAASVVQAGGAVQHVWLTRQDERVCTVCAPLHLTITDKRPIHDTHPRCRCITIPLIDGETGNRSTFETFVRRLRGTPPVAAF